MIYLTNFTNHTNYNLSKDNLSKPNISVCLEERDVYYNPYVDPYNGHDYVEIGGLKWATMNIGANSITDTGLYFQWGDTQGYTAAQVGSGAGQKYFGWADYELGNGGSSASDMTKYNSTDNKTVLEAVDDAATVNMGSGWRMPTEADFNALSAATTNVWVTDYQGSGVNGRLFTDKNDSSKVLFFPAAGRCSDGSVNDVGSSGRFWSRSLGAKRVVLGRSLDFDSGYCAISNDNRRNGYTVRGVID